jgi:hypothetical protein
MMSISRALTGLAFATLLAGAAHAQDGQEGSAAFTGSMRLTVSPAQAQQIISERLLRDGVAAGFQTLRQTLELTPAQEPRWRDFVLASSVSAQPIDPSTLVDEQAPTLRQARAHLDLQREMLAREARRVKTMERLYNALDARQKSAFDAGIAMIGSLTVASASNG